MQLFYTPRSHFSRKIRMLVGGLNLDMELLDIGDVAECNAPLFGPNPLMKVPTLVDGKCVIFDSDHIAQYIVRTYDPADRFHVLTTNHNELNARAVMNGVMATEVELILAARTGMNTRAHRRFDKMRESISAGLRWLDRNVQVFPNEPTYLGFHLIAMWEHLDLYGVCALDFPNVREQATRWNDLPYVTSTKPV